MISVVWLASYPKSGNTWVRALLTNYTCDAGEPASINDLQGIVASARDIFDDAVGVEASDLTPEEVERLRCRAYDHLASHAAASPLFLKVHDAYRSRSGRALFTPSLAVRVVYIVRDPRDVAVSFAHHMGLGLDAAVQRLCSDSTLAGARDSIGPQLPQSLLSWSDHVDSWVGEAALAACVVRYEDLVERTAATFRTVIEAAGFVYDEDRAARAVAYSSLDRLRAQEAEAGFRERGPGGGPFFRTGRAGGWKKTLPPELAARLQAAHGEVMRRFGYMETD